MIASRQNVMAIRAITAILIRTTLGWLLAGITLVAVIVAVLTGYNASRGLTLLWILFYFSLLVAITGALAMLIVYILTMKLLPRRLRSDERIYITKYSRNLTKRLLLLRVPLPLMLWNLFMQVAVEVHESKEKRRLEKTIAQSKSLSDGFRVIRGYFE